MESQNKEILKHLKKGKTITGRQASRMFDCDRLAARVHDLKDLGYNIVKEMIKKNGKRFAEYRLLS